MFKYEKNKSIEIKESAHVNNAVTGDNNIVGSTVSLHLGQQYTWKKKKDAASKILQDTKNYCANFDNPEQNFIYRQPQNSESNLLTIKRNLRESLAKNLPVLDESDQKTIDKLVSDLLSKNIQEIHSAKDGILNEITSAIEKYM